MAETNFTPFPLLETDRLILRPLKKTDDIGIFQHRSDAIINTYLEDFRHESIQQTQAFIERVQNEIETGKTILWVITEKANDDFLGTICLWNISKAEEKAETGYTLCSEFHGLGYMNEALVKIIDFGFHIMKLKTIVAYTHEQNENSIKLLKRNHFKQGNPEKEAGNNRVFYFLTNTEV